MNTPRLRSIMFTAAAVLGFAGAGAVLRMGPSVAQATPSGIPTDGSIADTAERVVDSVVNISTSHQEKVEADPFAGNPFGGDAESQPSMAKGSGVIVTASGRILTNSHVVDGADDIKVTLPDGTEVAAKVIGKDTHADIAVLQLEGKFPPLKPITFGDSSTLRLGELVLAVGDGMGIGKSVSMGIVSAKGRQDLHIEDYEDFIQTDAVINPGNSGGALVNLKGELVGINTAIASRSGGYQGIGFAIPTNMARPIMETLVRDGKISRGYLGVSITTVTPAILKAQRLGASEGVLVAEIQPGGPAAMSRGLVQGDVIVAVGGQPVKTDNELRKAIAAARPGTTIDLEVFHQDAHKAIIKAKLGELPDQPKQQEQELPQQFHEFQRRQRR